MLVLARHVNQRIYIGDDIIITVAGIGENSVRIGITAPSNIRILREELLTVEQKENLHAPSANPPATTTGAASAEDHYPSKLRDDYPEWDGTIFSD